MTRLKDTNLNLRVSEITKFDRTSKSQFFSLVFTGCTEQRSNSVYWKMQPYILYGWRTEMPKRHDHGTEKQQHDQLQVCL